MKKFTTFLLLTVVLLGCVSTDYQFGDLSKAYCQSTTVDERDLAKAALSWAGVGVGPDYCATVGLIDAMLDITNDDPDLT